jgi:integrase/recombinase XerD
MRPFIGNKAKEALWRWMIKRPDDCPWLFCTNRGEQMKKLRMHRIVAGIGKKIGIKAYPHRLRHTFATWYIKEGGDPLCLST